MSRIPMSDESLDVTENNEPYLDDSEFDDHYHELDFDEEFDPYEIDDPAIEDEGTYGSEG